MLGETRAEGKGCGSDGVSFEVKFVFLSFVLFGSRRVVFVRVGSLSCERTETDEGREGKACSRHHFMH